MNVMNKMKIDASAEEQQEKQLLFKPRISEESDENTVIETKGNVSPNSQEKINVVMVEIDKLVPFSEFQFRPYSDARLEQLANDIERSGQNSAIIIRAIDNGRYEILCGHNRVNAVKLLNWTNIRAEIRENISDEEALNIVIGDNVNQQSFADWSYAQRIRVVRHYDQYIRDNTQQGRRTDLGETSVYDRQKSDDKKQRATLRDKMARKLGISPAAFSQYRKILRLEDEMIDDLCELLESGRLSFPGAYRIAQLKGEEGRITISLLKKNPKYVLKGNAPKELYARSKSSESELKQKEIKDHLQEVTRISV